mgnify:CR=1 FL=1|jgi:RNA-binding protein
MPQLSNSQRDYLRREAHSLKPLVQIGKQGLTEAVQASIEQALSTRELIKVKFLDFRDQKQELSEELARNLGGILVSVIGNIAIIYRQHPDAEKRQIVLPR